MTGSLGSFAQAAAVNALQSLAVTQVKSIADSFLDRNGNPTVRSEAVRTALQALVGCAGAAPTGNCASGALGAASSVVLNTLVTALLDPEERDANNNIIPRSLADQQARTALIATLTGAIAGALNANANVASTAGLIETENNAVARTRAGTVGSASLTGMEFEQWKITYASLYKARVDQLRERFGNLSTAQLDKIIQDYATADSSDVAFAGGKDALEKYLTIPSNTIWTLRLEKKAYVDAQVLAIVNGLTLTAQQRRELLDDFTNNRRGAGDTVERAYDLSVGEARAFAARFGSKYRTELETANFLLGLLPTNRAVATTLAVADVTFEANGYRERAEIDSILNNAQDAGFSAVLALREVRNQQSGGGFRVENINGRLYFVGKPAIGEPRAGLNPVFGSQNARIGFDGEVRLANELHQNTGQFVVSYGNGDGIRGTDLITVGPDGQVTLWDNRYRSNPTTIAPSPAATVRSPAERRVYQDLIGNSALPESVRQAAIDNLKKGNYRAVTAGDGGGARNSRVLRFVDSRQINTVNRVSPSRAWRARR